MRVIFVYIVIIGLLVQSCTSDVRPAFLLKIYSYGSTNDQWMIVSDENGRLLDYKQVKAEGTYEFTGNPAQKLTLTTLSVYSGNTAGDYYYTAYAMYGIPLGTEMPKPVSTPNETTPGIKGAASFTINGYAVNQALLTQEHVDIPSIAANFGEGYWPSTQYNYGSPISVNGSKLAFDFQLRNTTSDILGIAYRNNLPVYKWFKGVKAGDAIVSNLSDFDLSKTIPTTRSIAGFYVLGFTGDTFSGGYYLSNAEQWRYSATSDLTKAPQPGYIDGFDRYLVSATSTVMSDNSKWETITYNKAGAISSLINMPEYSLSFSNRSLDNFSFSFNQDYTYSFMIFADEKMNSSSRVTWQVLAPAGAKIVRPQIPKEFTDKYASFRTDNLGVYFMDLTKEFRAGDTYEALNFPTRPRRKEYETVQYHVTLYK